MTGRVNYEPRVGESQSEAGDALRMMERMVSARREEQGRRGNGGGQERQPRHAGDSHGNYRSRRSASITIDLNWRQTTSDIHSASSRSFPVEPCSLDSDYPERFKVFPSPSGHLVWPSQLDLPTPDT